MKTKITTLYAILTIVNFSIQTQAQNSTIIYSTDTSNIANPERGFTAWTYAFTSIYKLKLLNTANLNQMRNNKKQTIIFRYFYLDTNFTAPIPDESLNYIRQDFDSIRKAGFKVIARFGYREICPNTDSNGNCVTPYKDSPPKSLVLKHISQLKPILRANADVILTLQNGFWGLWGENYYSDYFGCASIAPLTAQNWADRKEVTDSLLAIFPSNTLISLRYPLLKSKMYNLNLSSDSLTVNTAHNGSKKSLLGAHNDCFLAAANDWTFSDTTKEKPYWDAESRYTIMGGETCRDMQEFTNCSNAVKELARFEWSYLNDYYHPSVLSRWKTEGCYNEVRNRLGYRLEMNKAVISQSISATDSIHFYLEITNTGFAAPINERLVQLVLRNKTTQQLIFINIPNQDIRYWFANKKQIISKKLPLPSNISVGQYELFLNLPDYYSSVASNINYKIRFANLNTWDPSTGMNKLNHILTINGAPTSSFSVSSSTICPGADITVTDNSLGNPTAWLWSFPGATPSQSTLKNPGLIKYLSTGTFTISLKVSNSNGDDTECKTIVCSSLSSNAGSDQQICSGSATMQAINPAIGSGVWSFVSGNGVIANSSSPNTSISSVATGTNVLRWTVSHAGCANTYDDVIIKKDNLPSVSISSGSTNLCKGQSTTLSASGASTYSWSPPNGLSSTTGSLVIANPNTSTTYYVTGYVGNCSSSKSITINRSSTSAPSISVSPVTATICSGSSKVISASGTGGVTYTWSPPTGLSSTTGKKVTAKPTTSTVYTVTATKGGCSSSTTSSIFVTNCSLAREASSVLDSVEAKSLIAYPNPYSGQTTIRYSLNSTTDVNIIIYNSFGQQVSMTTSATQIEGDYSFNFSARNLGYPPGIYWINLQRGNHVDTIKVIEVE